jgi:predicted negative regulator of RcsB-dependent stress response
MIDYETEEQQIHAIKKWWKENYKAVMSGVILGFFLIGGYQYYGIYKKEQSASASSMYESSYLSLEEKKTQVIVENTKKLKEEHGNSLYVYLSSLLEAKAFVDEKKYKKAQESLEFVVQNAKEDIAMIARVRLSRVLQQQKEYKKAIEVLNVDYPQDYSAIFEEAKADVYMLLEQKDKAKISYGKARSSTKEPKILEMLMIKENSVQ